MRDADEKFLDIFPTWLRSLGEDVETLLALAGVEDMDEGARRQLVAGINYVFKSLDLIPDGIDDIGYLDDAFVLRVAASLVPEDGRGSLSDDQRAALSALAEDAKVVAEFLGEETYARLVNYTKGLRKSSARGRTVGDILGDPDIWGEFSAEVREFSRSIESPAFSRDEKTLVKLRAFFDAKLPK